MTNLQTIERRSLVSSIYQRRRVAAVTRLTLQNEHWRTANEARLPRSSSFSFDIHTNVYARESLEAVPRFMHSDWSGNRLLFLVRMDVCIVDTCGLRSMGGEAHCFSRRSPKLTPCCGPKLLCMGRICA